MEPHPAWAVHDLRHFRDGRSPLSGDKQESCHSVKPFFLALAATAWAWSRLANCRFSATARSVGLLLALVLSSVAAYVLGRPLFHGRGLAGAYFAIVTLCAAVIVETLAQQWSFIGGFNGLLGIPPFVAPWRREPMPISLPTEIYLLMLGPRCSYFSFYLTSVRRRSEQYLPQSETMTSEPLSLVTTLSAIRSERSLSRQLVSGLAGALFVKQFSFAAPSLIGFGLSTEVLIWVAVGGRNVLLAAFLGALLVRSVEGVLSDRLGDYWLLALGVLFVITVVLMPSGLLGQILMPPVPRRFR